MISIFRNRTFLKLCVAYVCLSHLTQLFLPIEALALTSGPSAPEVQSFEPIGTSELVNVATGSFSYSIPLMDVGGQPITCSYHSGIGMDDEPSTIGLGWNLNIGQINRNMQGLPDDFKGDEVTKEFSMKPNKTWGVSGGLGLELFGIGKKTSSSGNDSSGFGASFGIDLNLGVFHNNYKGLGFEFGLSPSISAGSAIKSKQLTGLGLSGSLGVGFNSQAGTDISPSIDLASRSIDEDNSQGGQSSTTTKFFVANGSLGFNSRVGLKQLSFGASYSNHTKTGVYSEDGKVKYNYKKNMGMNGGVGLSFGSPSYIPQLNFPYTTSSFTLNGTVGLALFGQHPNLRLSGYFSKQRFTTHLIISPAYGYLYSDLAPDSSKEYKKMNPLLDFNREKDGVFIAPGKSKNQDQLIGTPNLPLTKNTFDVFSANAQGLGASFRPYRGDWGFVHDPKIVNPSDQGFLGVEVGAAAYAHGGANLMYSYSQSSSGRWESDNMLRKKAHYFTKEESGEPDYEPVYFKNMGEKTVQNDMDFYENVGDDEAVRVVLTGLNGGVAANQLMDNKGKKYSSNSYRRSKRDRRNTAFSFLTAAEASQYGLETMLRSYTLNSTYKSDTLPYDTLHRVNGDMKAHHISEISVMGPGGARHIFGIPAYNVQQREVSFNASGRITAPDVCTGLVTYDSDGNDKDNGLGNTRGDDNLFSANNLPPYAYAYLLTHVVSPDYVDRTGDGISDDDFGTYYKFNYSRINDDFHWRAPFQEVKANFSEGFESKDYDDKASYVYGRKHIWYIHSLESRHYIAEFTYSDSKSSLGVVDENGGKDVNQKLKKLDKITLYGKEDRKTNGTNATPIKTVHFRYSYELCDGIPNSSSNEGKLTLKEVFFTYGKSEKARFSPYKFVYADHDHDGTPDNAYNPDYNLKAYDRWGNFMPNDCDLPNWRFPYVNQKIIPSGDTYYDASDPTRTYADAYAEAWELSTIYTPSGGKIDIYYESNDYSYVQNKKAMQMFRVKGFSNDSSGTIDSLLFSKGSGPSDYTNFNYLFVDLPESLGNSAEFKERYLADSMHLYFNCRMAVNNGKKSPGNRLWEQIAGYVDVEDGGLRPGSNDVGWILIKERGIRGGDQNEKAQGIAFLGWNFIRKNLSERVFPGSNPEGTDESAIKGLAGFAMDIAKIFKGYNRLLRTNRFADKIQPVSSWVRLFDPDGMKKGGGARVHKVVLSDNWQDMSGADEKTYGQTYTYTQVDPVTQEEISSGVAGNEPYIGADENPLRQPKSFVSKKALSANEEYYLETPMGEMFLPGPNIVYARVEVQSLKDSRIGRHATGKVVHEFYTARDYPVIFEETAMDPRRTPNFDIKLFRIKSQDNITVSQGYAIHLNDMHGKPKGQQVYAEGKDEPFTWMRYHYRNEKPYRQFAANKLDNNEVSVIYADNTTGEARVGMDIEIVMDERQQKAFTIGAETQLNLEAFPLIFIPAIIPTGYLKPIIEKTRFRSITATKVIHRYGILDSSTVFEDGALVGTKNLAFDAETGEVLLTRTTNEFRDPLYNFSVPAHWAYDEGMGPSYKNLGVEWQNSDLRSALASGHLIKGDELMLEDDALGPVYSKGWVLDVSLRGVIDEAGQLIDSTHVYDRIKVLRSGRDNQQTVPIASLVTKTDPRNLGLDSFTQVLSAGASEFIEYGNLFCGMRVRDTVCKCWDPSSKGVEFQALLNALIANDDWLESEVDLSSYPEYTASSYLKDEINPSPTAGCTTVYKASVVTVDDCDRDVHITFEEKCGSSYTQLCSLALEMDTCSVFCLDFFDSFKGLKGVDLDTTVCDSSTTFTIVGVIPDGCGDLEITFNGSNDCMDMRQCRIVNVFDYVCIQPGDTLNPFLAGIRGTWFPKRSYSYLTDRVQGGTQLTDIRDEGSYSEFTSFWKYLNDKWYSDPQAWTWTASISKVLPNGQEIESYDPLYRYSSALFGYDLQLPIAVAGNARYEQIASINFEVEADITKTCDAHVYFNDRWGGESLVLTDNYAHSGLQSAEIGAGKYLSILHHLSPDSSEAPDDGVPYRLQSCDCAGYFNPDSGIYVTTFWVRNDTFLAGNPIFGYADMDVEILADRSVLTPDRQTRSRVIEGWQRVEIIFELPGGVEELEFRFKNNFSTDKGYIDDLRIHPFHASMGTYVYDPVALRLLAEGDANGFFKFYEYDLSGQLIGVKQETERGIVSLNEYRNNTFNP